MKKFIVATFLLTTLFVVAACGNANNSMTAKATEIKSNNTVAKASQQEIKIVVGEHVLRATLVNNSSTKALLEKLKQGPVTVKMHDYGNFEKVGELGFNLPTNDQNITTVPGDLILYLGHRFVIYYDTNTWDFTRLGKVKDADQKKLKEILGKDDVTIRIEK